MRNKVYPLTAAISKFCESHADELFAGWNGFTETANDPIVEARVDHLIKLINSQPDQIDGKAVRKNPSRSTIKTYLVTARRKHIHRVKEEKVNAVPSSSSSSILLPGDQSKKKQYTVIDIVMQLKLNEPVNPSYSLDQFYVDMSILSGSGLPDSIMNQLMKDLDKKFQAWEKLVRTADVIIPENKPQFKNVLVAHHSSNKLNIASSVRIIARHIQKTIDHSYDFCNSSKHDDIIIRELSLNKNRLWIKKQIFACRYSTRAHGGLDKFKKHDQQLPLFV